MAVDIGHRGTAVAVDEAAVTGDGTRAGEEVLHEAAGLQNRPAEPGCLEVLLDLPVRAEPQPPAFARAPDRNLHDLGHARVIDRRAQVAIGTLYGHFPNRRALVGALLQHRNEVLFELGEHLLTDPAPLSALTSWISAAAEHGAAYRGLAAMLADGIGNDKSELHQSCLRMAGIGRDLAARARDAGAIRPGVTGTDVTALINAVAWTSERMSPQQAGRLLDLTVDGLRPARDSDIQTERVAQE
jgi:AcrR family transcriptional regulator